MSVKPKKVIATIYRDGQEIRTVFYTNSDRYDVNKIGNTFWFCTKMNNYKMHDIEPVI
mgnify:FL=1|tara:strand:- start:5888 stop:6061 length:174 start_codon:yes stop_codon:yes gene_type:complete